MSDKEGHLRKASHNLRFVKTLNIANTKYLDWAIVVLFYTACHYVDAYFATQGLLEFRNHGQRNAKVEELLPENIAGYYLTLYQAGHDARYQPYQAFNVSDVIEYEVENLHQIEEYILALLKKSS